MQLVFAFLFSRLFFFSYRKGWQLPFLALPISRFCALGLMPTKFSRQAYGVQYMIYSTWSNQC